MAIQLGEPAAGSAGPALLTAPPREVTAPPAHHPPAIDDDRWHAMAGDYRAIAEVLGGVVRKLTPDGVVGRTIAKLARSKRGDLCAMRLRLVALALAGEPSTTAAYTAAAWARRDAGERGWGATLMALLAVEGGSTCRSVDAEAEQVIAGELALTARVATARADGRPADYMTAMRGALTMEVIDGHEAGDPRLHQHVPSGRLLTASRGG
jgi:hypothetical protein